MFFWWWYWVCRSSLILFLAPNGWVGPDIWADPAWPSKNLLVLNAGNLREWSIITSDNHPSNPQQPPATPSNPQQPIHSLRLAPVRKRRPWNVGTERELSMAIWSAELSFFFKQIERTTMILGHWVESSKHDSSFQVGDVWHNSVASVPVISIFVGNPRWSTGRLCRWNPDGCWMCCFSRFSWTYNHLFPFIG